MIDVLARYVKKSATFEHKSAVIFGIFREIQRLEQNLPDYSVVLKKCIFLEQTQEETIGEFMKIKLYSLGLGTVLASLAIAGCGGPESGAGVNTTNANRVNASNGNAVVVNANNSNTGVVSTTNTTTNHWTNANSVTREEYNAKRAEYERDKGTSTIGQGANDSWLWFKTRAALLTTADLRESTINVDVVNDVVTLKGTVETAAQKTKAEQVAKGIEGVKSVKNELKVAPADSMTNVNTNSMVNGNRSANTNKK